MTDLPAIVGRSAYRPGLVPDAWGRGTFTGNGLLGVMTWRQDPYPVVWDLGRTDVMDRSRSEREGKGFKNNDTPAYRVPIGRLVMMPAGEVVGSELELDLWNAEDRGTIRLAAGGEIRFSTMTHATRELIVIDLEASGGVSLPEIAFQPGISAPLSLEFGVKIDHLTLNPPPTIAQRGGVHACLQRCHISPGYCTIWAVQRLGNTTARVWATVQRDHDILTARDRGESLICGAMAGVSAALLAEHRGWWQAYHALGGVDLPDERLEQFWWMQTYKAACSTRADRPAWDLLGPWTFRTVWAAMWWNLNVQLAYLPLYGANRLEIAESLPRLLEYIRPQLRKNAERFGPDAMLLPRASDRDGEGFWEGEWCNLPWVCHNLWLHWRMGGPDSLVPLIADLLRGATNAYMALLVEGDDGRLHLPVAISPEYPQAAPDTHINLALLRWGLRTLIELDESGIQPAATMADRRVDPDPLAGRWRQTLQRLTPFPTDDTGLMIGAGVPLAESHRHFSHLLAFYPLALLDESDPADRALIERSLDHWQSLDSALVGYSWTVAAAMFARLGRGDEALDCLNRYLSSNLAQPNTMYLELGGWAGPTCETPSSVNSAVQEMLLQSHRGVVRVFPAVPAVWKTIAFTKLRAHGAFVVSAEQREGRTGRIEILSERGGRLRLCNPHAPALPQTNQPPTTVSPGSAILEWDTEPGEVLELRAP